MDRKLCKIEKCAHFTYFKRKNPTSMGIKLCTFYTFCSHSHLTLFISALTSPHSPFSSFALTLTIAIGQTVPLLPPIIKTSLSPLSLFLSFITFSSILFVDVGILRFWSDLTEEHGVVFIGVDFSKSWRRLWSIFAATVEEDQPSEPTKATRQWTRWWTTWWTSASSKLKS